MGRPPLDVGTFGDVYVKQVDGKWLARVQFRDFDGVRRPVSKWGATRAEAERRLKRSLTDRKTPQGAGLTGGTKVSELADVWLAQVDAADVATSTRQLYRGTVDRYVKPALGGLRLQEVRVPEIDRALTAVRLNGGTGSAKTVKSCLSGMFKLAVRHGAIELNPVRDVTPIAVERKKIRALEPAEVDRLCDLLRSDQSAVDWDLPDLVEFMLGTGCRIGEACAVRQGINGEGKPILDLDAGTVEINATIIRAKGVGLVVQERPKTAAGWRVLALPSYVVDMIRRRDTEARLRPPQGIVFGSPGGHLRDGSNTAGDLRDVLSRVGGGEFEWVTSHVFRKTVATMLDRAGFSAREIADQLGHARPSLTQDVYMGRNVVSAKAADALDR